MTKEAKKTEKKNNAAEEFDLDGAVAYYAEQSKMQENGIRHIEKAAIVKRLTETHGVDMDAVELYRTAMKDERAAIAKLTSKDLIADLDAAKKADASEEAISATTATTSFWRPDGTESLTVIGHDTTGDTTIDDGGNVVPVVKHGRIRTTISAHDGIRRKTVDDVAASVSKWFE